MHLQNVRTYCKFVSIRCQWVLYLRHSRNGIIWYQNLLLLPCSTTAWCKSLVYCNFTKMFSLVSKVALFSWRGCLLQKHVTLSCCKDVVSGLLSRARFTTLVKGHDADTEIIRYLSHGWNVDGKIELLGFLSAIEEILHFCYTKKCCLRDMAKMFHFCCKTNFIWITWEKCFPRHKGDILCHIAEMFPPCCKRYNITGHMNSIVDIIIVDIIMDITGHIAGMFPCVSKKKKGFRSRCQIL